MSTSRRPSWPAYLVTADLLVYAGAKAYLAAEDRLGIPGGPRVPAEAYQQLDHVWARQLGLAGMGVLAAVLALATVRPWGRRIPRWLVLTALGVQFVLSAMGASAIVTGVFLGPDPLGWPQFLGVLHSVAGLALWGVMVWSYLDRHAPEDFDRPLPWTWVACVTGALTAIYGALKLYWAVGGTVLLREAPLPPEMIELLVNRDPWAVGFGLWGTVVLAAGGVLVTLAMARPWGLRIPRWLLATPAFLVCAAMLLRSTVTAVGDVDWLLTVGTGASARTARWDLAVWAPYFFVWGVFWGLAGWFVLTRRPRAPR
ncbi:DUF3995 domain-containing protein [Streptoalloteichus hindustanus]|uniref:Uncharacterized protein n=1 Tax=Streptoalloteichus hindustanus TaxID=2017 RepID=A0A1M4UP24_STRHI|nr:DUF3995 domain-containing protein [Streptoalloteichus hindustanus]SHE58408.1 Protein of unknown function [Streptoalloteichus hindustanus]